MRYIAFCLVLSFASVCLASAPVVVAETDEYLIYSDHSIRQKPISEETPALLSGDEARTLSVQAALPARAASEELQARGDTAVEGDWRGFGGVPYGCNGNIRVINEGPDGKIYLGGDFSACNDVIANNIAAWDPATNTFEALGPGLPSNVNDIAFSSTGDPIVASSNVLRWNGEDWAPIGPGYFFNSTVLTVVVDNEADDETIYAGGFFSQIFRSGDDPLSVNRIAKWDGASGTWMALGDGLNSTVETLMLVGQTLFAGGGFTASGDQELARVAQWDGDQWLDVGGGADGTVRAFASDGSSLFASGFFNSAGGVQTGPVALWDGESWKSIGFPTCCVNDIVYAGGRLFATGGFSSLGDGVSSRIAIWDEDSGSWSAPAADSRFLAPGAAIFSKGSDIYVSGNFSVIGTFAAQSFPTEGTFVNRIARFNSAEQEWQPLGNGDGNGLNGPVTSMLQFNGEVWVTGDFTAAGMRPMIRGLARWTGGQWLPVPGDNLPCGSFRGLATGLDGDLFAINSCLSVGDLVWGSTARFDGTRWEPLGQGLSGFVSAIAVDPMTGDVYYAGSFTRTNGDNTIVANSIARWDGVDWNSVGDGDGNGVSSTTSSFPSISRLAAFDGGVMVAGSFDRAGAVEVDRIALWDRSAWSSPGDGLSRLGSSAIIIDLAAQGSNVFAAGFIGESGDQALRNIARWDGDGWQPLVGSDGEGIGFTPRSLHATDDTLYVGGSFIEAGARSAQRIAQWDGSEWRSLGSGADNGLAFAAASFNPVSAMLATSRGVFVGGVFGGSASVTSPNLILFGDPIDPDLIFQTRFEPFFEED